jgi:SAM-dependent methyltransferase
MVSIRAKAVARRRRRLAARYLSGQGIEVGALHEPLDLPWRASARYVDRLDLAGLRRHYPELEGEALVEPDIVDDGEQLLALESGSQDFVVANHFIEHCQDPLGTLISFLRVLRPGGVIYMAVPDRHAGVDVQRPPTSFEHLRRDHEGGAQRSRREHYDEWARLVDRRLGNIAEHDVVEHARALEGSGYSIHFHVWNRDEFAEFLDRAASTYALPIQVLHVVPNGHEFIVILRKQGGPSAASSPYTRGPWHRPLHALRGRSRARRPACRRRRS